MNKLVTWLKGSDNKYQNSDIGHTLYMHHLQNYHATNQHNHNLIYNELNGKIKYINNHTLGAKKESFKEQSTLATGRGAFDPYLEG